MLGWPPEPEPSRPPARHADARAAGLPASGGGGGGPHLLAPPQRQAVLYRPARGGRGLGGRRRLATAVAALRSGCAECFERVALLSFKLCHKPTSTLSEPRLHRALCSANKGRSSGKQRGRRRSARYAVGALGGAMVPLACALFDPSRHSASPLASLGAKKEHTAHTQPRTPVAEGERRPHLRLRSTASRLLSEAGNGERWPICCSPVGAQRRGQQATGG